MPQHQAVYYTLLSACLSFFVGVINQYQQLLNKNLNQPYIYTMSQLSPPQRQFILVLISTFAYIVLIAYLYSFIEGWHPEDALYWSLVTLTTIGFGDFVPKTNIGKLALPFLASIGIFIFGSLIFSVRLVALELLTLELADQYEKALSPRTEFMLDDGENDMPSQVRARSVDYEELPFSTNKRRMKKSRSTPPSNRIRNKFVISRAEYLPHLTINGTDTEHRRSQIVSATKKTLLTQLYFSSLVTSMNIIVFGGIFAYLEHWSFLDGIYFSFSALSTIAHYLNNLGFGDQVPRTSQARAIFIWHVFFGIASMTYLGSIISELVLDRWVIEISRIQGRVDVYEHRAKLKKLSQLPVNDNSASTTPKIHPIVPRPIVSRQSTVTVHPPTSDTSSLVGSYQRRLKPEVRINIDRDPDLDTSNSNDFSQLATSPLIDTLRSATSSPEPLSSKHRQNSLVFMRKSTPSPEPMSPVSPIFHHHHHQSRQGSVVIHQPVMEPGNPWQQRSFSKSRSQSKIGHDSLEIDSKGSMDDITNEFTSLLARQGEHFDYSAAGRSFEQTSSVGRPTEHNYQSRPHNEFTSILSRQVIVADDNSSEENSESERSDEMDSEEIQDGEVEHRRDRWNLAGQVRILSLSSSRRKSLRRVKDDQPSMDSSMTPPKPKWWPVSNSSIYGERLGRFSTN
ncbi:Potassium channel [Nowakowskiella sp. JEL0078]|nr:Potassium channel [Nowakowskiella sp. JEL0078]